MTTQEISEAVAYYGIENLSREQLLASMRDLVTFRYVLATLLQVSPDAKLETLLIALRRFLPEDTEVRR